MFTDSFGKLRETLPFAVGLGSDDAAPGIKTALLALDNNVIPDLTVVDAHAGSGVHAITVTFTKNPGTIPMLAIGTKSSSVTLSTVFVTSAVGTKVWARRRRALRSSPSLHAASLRDLRRLHPVSLLVFVCVCVCVCHHACTRMLARRVCVARRLCTHVLLTLVAQEHVTCSNRGVCDYDTGLCKCFKGFYLVDCSLQSALAY